jgi:hypothetical protein
MPRQEGNEERQSHHHEEWQASYPGRLPYLRHQDVQNRQVIVPHSYVENRHPSLRRMPIFFLKRTGKFRLLQQPITYA